MSVVLFALAWGETRCVAIHVPPAARGRTTSLAIRMLGRVPDSFHPPNAPEQPLQAQHPTV